MNCFVTATFEPASVDLVSSLWLLSPPCFVCGLSFVMVLSVLAAISEPRSWVCPKLVEVEELPESS